MAEKPSGPPSSEFKTREPSTDDLLEESLRIQSAISNTLLDIGDKLNADNVGRGHVLLEVSANLPKNKCGSKGSVVGDGTDTGTDTYWRAGGRAGAIKNATDEAERKAKDAAQNDAGAQMTNVICHAPCKPVFDTANPVVTITSSTLVSDTPGKAFGGTIVWTATATYEVPWECK